MLGSGKAQALSDAQTVRFFKHRVAERNIGQRKSAMPEQIGFGVALAARLETGLTIPPPT